MRTILLRILFYIGFFRLWYWLTPKSVTILMLHGVMDEEEPASQWRPFRAYLSRRDLDATLSLLSQYFVFISIDEALAILEGRQPLDKQYCVLTFDDGLLNNLTHAMPILRRYGVPAAKYLVTDQVEHDEPFWFDRLDYALQHNAHLSEAVEVFGQRVALEHGSPSALKNSFLNIKQAAFESNHDYKTISQEIERVTQDLENLSGKSLLDVYGGDPWSKVMSWEDVESAASGGDITLGSHTIDHILLGKVSESEIERQLRDSKKALEEHIRQPCVHFCYPNGSLHPKAPEILSSLGYRSAVTTEHGKNHRDSFDPFLLKRYNLPADKDALYCLAKISGATDLLP